MSDKDINQLLAKDDTNTSKKLNEKNNPSFTDEIENDSKLSLTNKPRIRPRLMRLPKTELIESSPEHESIEIDKNQITGRNGTENSLKNEQTIDSMCEKITIDAYNGEEVIEPLNEKSKKSRSSMRQISKGLLKLQKLRPGIKSKKLETDKMIDSEIVNNEMTQSQSLNDQSYDPTQSSNNILNLKIHRVEHLKFIEKIVHPLIQIHIIDSTTGKYLSKKHINQCVTSYYENKLLDYVMPVMTKPCHNIQNKSLIWDENIIYNEDYDYLVKSGIIYFFEILEFETLTDHSNINKLHTFSNSHIWWQRIGWAFLRPISDKIECSHTGHKVRLQLYKAVSIQKSNTKYLDTTELYNWWKSKKMTSILGTLTVTFESKSRLLLNLEPTLRSLFPFQSEISLKNSSKIENECKNSQNNENDNKIQNKKKFAQNDQILLWNRIEGQSCKIPKTRWHSLTGSGRGCFRLKFSNDGRKMSCTSPINSSNEYKIFIYEIPSTNLLSHFGHHNGIVYELDWSQDNQSLLSASNDCTARVWKLNDSNDCIGSILLPHPCFLYSAKFHIRNSDIVLTAGFDGIIRIWRIKDSNQTDLIQELNAFKGSALCLSWNHTINNEYQIFLGSDDGIIKVIEQTNDEWIISSTIIIKDLKSISINSICVHPTGNKLILFCRDGIHRMIDYKLQIIIQVYKGSINLNHFIRGSISPCGQLVFMCSEDSSVLVWKTETGERLYTYFDVGLNGLISQVEYHPFDHILAVCGLDTNASILLYRYVHESNKTKLNPIEDIDKDNYYRSEIPLNLRTKFQNAIIMLNDIIK